MAVKEVHNFGRSAKAKLLNIARKENLQYQLLVTRYFQERFIYRLSVSQYRNHFLLKGGALLYAHDRFKARPTIDIDFLGMQISNDRNHILNVVKEICSIPYEQDGVDFHTETLSASDIAIEKRYPGVRVALTVTMDSIKQDISMDIGFGDIVTPAPTSLDYPMLLDGFPDTDILAYSVETVIAEKFQAMIERAENNSRMKDFYDLWVLLRKGKFDSAILKEAIWATFKNRNTVYVEDHPVFKKEFRNNESLALRWKAFVKKLKNDTVLDFSETVAFLQDELSPYWDSLQITE